MASQTASPAPAPSAQVVGHAFVEQYYLILHRSPESVYKFYQDSSVISRPDPNGVMTSVSTMQAINDKILSLDYKNFKAEIKTADAQESHKGGVIVLVTGCLTGMDNVRRPFSQTFFLAPQDKGYFVLNDVFRYMDESDSVENRTMLANSASETTCRTPPTLDAELERAPDMDQHTANPPASVSEEYLNNGAEVCDPSDNEAGSVVEEEQVVETAAHSSQNELQQVESTTSVQDDIPKKSYASIVKVMKTSAATNAVYVPTTTIRAASAKAEGQSVVSPAPEVETPATGSISHQESTNKHDEVESRSIYIRGLPMNATVSQLEEEFKKFGSIKPGGIQVRSNRMQGVCFGFVEFESSSSMHNAIKASTVTIGGCQAFIEEKRTTSFRANGSGRGRFPPGRGSFRNDNFRGRGNFGGRGYGRGDFGSRGDFSGRGRGTSGRGGEGYRWVNQSMNVRVGRSGGTDQNTVSV